jgi:hypothetical protein
MESVRGMLSIYLRDVIAERQREAITSYIGLYTGDRVSQLAVASRFSPPSPFTRRGETNKSIERGSRREMQEQDRGCESSDLHVP